MSTLAVTDHRSFSSNVVGVSKDRTVEYQFFTVRMERAMIGVVVVNLLVIRQIEGSSVHDVEIGQET